MIASVSTFFAVGAVDFLQTHILLSSLGTFFLSGRGLFSALAPRISGPIKPHCSTDTSKDFNSTVAYPGGYCAILRLYDSRACVCLLSVHLRNSGRCLVLLVFT